MEGIKTLHENGWEISNHSSAHYPVSEAVHIKHFAEEFLECEEALQKHLGRQTDFWVLPFDRKSLDNHELLTYFDKADNTERHLVLVGNKVNTSYDPNEKIIYRIDAPCLNSKDLLRYLASLAE